MRKFIAVGLIIVSLSPSPSLAQTPTAPGDAQLRAAIAILTDEKNAAESRALSALVQLEAVTKERDALKAAPSAPAPKDDKK